jgi:hypothetical protein
MAIASFLDTEALGFIDGEIANVRYQAGDYTTFEQYMAQRANQ